LDGDGARGAGCVANGVGGLGSTTWMSSVDAVAAGAW
jgi:hypothetical protein